MPWVQSSRAPWAPSRRILCLFFAAKRVFSSAAQTKGWHAAQASLNVHLDYDSKGGNAAGVSSAVFERVNLYKEGQTLNIADLDNAAKAEIVPEAKEAEPVVAAEAVVVAEPVVEAEAVVEAEVVEAEPVVAAEAVVEAEVVDSSSDGDDLMAKLSELDGDSADDSPKEEDDLMAKLNELDDTENKPKKKEKKSDDDEDQSGMDDILGKLDEL